MSPNSKMFVVITVSSISRKSAFGKLGGISPGYWGVQVKVFDIYSHELGARVERTLFNKYFVVVRSAVFCGAAVACIVDLVAANGEAHTLFDGFVGFIGNNDLEVGGLLALWNL